MSISKHIIAKEIKLNFKLLIISLIVGFLSYPIVAYLNKGFKSLSYKNEYQNLSKSHWGYEGTVNDTLTNAQINNSKYIAFTNKKEKLESEISLFLPSEDIARIELPSLSIIKYEESLENNIDRSFGFETIKIAFLCFLLTALFLISGRYLFKLTRKSVKWVNTNAANEI